MFILLRKPKSGNTVPTGSTHALQHPASERCFLTVLWVVTITESCASHPETQATAVHSLVLPHSGDYFPLPIFLLICI